MNSIPFEMMVFALKGAQAISPLTGRLLPFGEGADRSLQEKLRGLGIAQNGAILRYRRGWVIRELPFLWQCGLIERNEIRRGEVPVSGRHTAPDRRAVALAIVHIAKEMIRPWLRVQRRCSLRGWDYTRPQTQWGLATSFPGINYLLDGECVSVGTVEIARPLPDVAGHMAKTIAVRRERFDRRKGLQTHPPSYFHKETCPSTYSP
jgi:hypothetical protein